ncbi:hypothetical protein IG193_03560 [Infirmifilum lucidum]|uniref:Uncharacterized protein n=1 Tax=Infirmifilum lucidum TaxID=2776706 RepID=A0A7L9FIK8_9CREN|nr:hypothetical protein [Infirmifilum lucidum]QOJ79547.1 hypothetical protein IG193_03560 [Infirmifilum lucidum]
MSNPGPGDEVEIVEVGEGDIAVLVAALRRLNNGVYALKVSLDFLNSRVGTLLDNIRELEKSLESHLEGFKSEREKFSSENRKALEELKSEAQKMTQEIKLSMDVFFEKLSREIERLYDSIHGVSADINTILSQMKEVELVMTDTTAAVKAEAGTLRTRYQDTEALISELSQRVSRLEETVLAAINELRISNQELSLRMSNIEKRLAEQPQARK